MVCPRGNVRFLVTRASLGEMIASTPSERFRVRLVAEHGLAAGPAPCLVAVGPPEAVLTTPDDDLPLDAVELIATCAGTLRALEGGAAIELPAHQCLLRTSVLTAPDLVLPRDTTCGQPTMLRVVLRGCAPMAEELVARFGRVLLLPPTASALRQLLTFARYDGCTAPIGLSEGGRLACSLLGALAENASVPGETTSRRSRTVRLALKLIRSRLDRPLGVGEVAAELGISPEHLARLFAKELGDSPGHVIAREKMRRARELLKDTRLAIGAIAERLGYASASHFTRCFRAEYDMAPSEYRAVASVGIA